MSASWSFFHISVWWCSKGLDTLRNKGSYVSSRPPFTRFTLNLCQFLSLSLFRTVWCCSGGQDRNKGSYVSLGREAEWAGQASGCLACCWLEQGQEGTMRWCETNFIPSWQFHLPAYPTYLPTYLTEYIFTYVPTCLPTSKEGAMCLCKTNFFPSWQFHLPHYTSTHCEAHKASGDMEESPWSLSPPNFIPSSCGNFT